MHFTLKNNIPQCEWAHFIVKNAFSRCELLHFILKNHFPYRVLLQTYIKNSYPTREIATKQLKNAFPWLIPSILIYKKHKFTYKKVFYNKKTPKNHCEIAVFRSLKSLLNQRKPIYYIKINNLSAGLPLLSKKNRNNRKE